jgi:hypothetical protein
MPATVATSTCNVAVLTVESEHRDDFIRYVSRLQRALDDVNRYADCLGRPVTSGLSVTTGADDGCACAPRGL